MQDKLYNSSSQKFINIFSNYFQVPFNERINPCPKLLEAACLELDDVNLEIPAIPDLWMINYPLKPMRLVLMIYQKSYTGTFQILLQRGASIGVPELFLISRPKVYKNLQFLLPLIYEQFDPETLNSPIYGGGDALYDMVMQTDPQLDVISFLLKHNADVLKGLQLAINRKNYGFIIKLISTGFPVNDSPFKEKILNLFIENYANHGWILERAYHELVDSVPRAESEESFIAAIKYFCRQYQLNSISELFVESKHLESLITAFFSKIEIIQYLARDIVTFNTEDYPNYLDIEKEFYDAAAGRSKIAERSNTFIEVPYRNQRPQSDNFDFEEKKKTKGTYKGFYTALSLEIATKININSIKNTIPDLKGSYINIILPEDLHKLGAFVVNAAENTHNLVNDRGFHYLISATRKDGHIFATLSIINIKTHKIHCHILINSWDTDAYNKFVTGRLNYEYCRVHGSESQLPPVLNGSLDLQAEDVNCSLYTSRICQVLYEIFITNHQLQEKLEGMHHPLSFDWQELRPFFMQCLQEKLPEFYEKNDRGIYQKLSEDKIKTYGLKKRWSIGNQFLFSEHKKHKKKIINSHEELKIVEDHFQVKF